MTYDQERQLRQVILRFVQAVSDRHSSLPKIKLVKLLYLLDLESWRQQGTVATGLDWVFHHYGPYTPTLEPVLERAEGVYFERLELTRQQQQGLAAANARAGHWAQAPIENEVVYLYLPLAGLPDEPIEDSFVARITDQVASRWAAAETRTLLEHVYSTAPVAHGTRYELIDWNLEPRQVGVFGSHARRFRISGHTRSAIDGAWQSWRETGRDTWTRHEPEEWLYDAVWAAAVDRMEADDAVSAVFDVRIVGQLPHARFDAEPGDG